MGTPFKMKGISPLKDEKHKGKKGTKGNIYKNTSTRKVNKKL